MIIHDISEEAQSAHLERQGPGTGGNADCPGRPGIAHQPFHARLCL